MKPDIEAMKQAIKTLSEKLERANKEIEELYRFKDRYEDLAQQHHHVLKQLDTKRNVTQVLVEKDDSGALCVLQLTRVLDTPDGMYIKGRV